MPCRGDDYDDLSNARRDADRVTQFLCALCREVDANQGRPTKIDCVAGLRSWWETHKEKDRKRREQEMADKQYRLSVLLAKEEEGRAEIATLRKELEALK